MGKVGRKKQSSKFNPLGNEMRDEREEKKEEKLQKLLEKRVKGEETRGAIIQRHKLEMKELKKNEISKLNLEE